MCLNEQIREEIRSLKVKERNLRNSVESKEISIQVTKNEIDQLNSQIENLQVEVGTPVRVNFTRKEQSELDTLSQEITALQDEISGLLPQVMLWQLQQLCQKEEQFFPSLWTQMMVETLHVFFSLLASYGKWNT